MQTNLSKKTAYTLAVVIAAAALYATSLKSYVLFHSMAELFSIVIAAGIFAVAWNTWKFMPNAYLLFIGVAYLYVAFIDLIHTLAYKGMGVFPGVDANLPTQFWIAARYLEAVSLFVAPFFLGKKLRVVPVAIVYFFATVILLLSIHSGVFPDAFIEGRGLTPFKVASEYIISLILAAAIIYLRKKNEYFEPPVLNLLIWSMITTIASEMAFTLYQDVYGLFNLLGHYFKIVSFYLIYAALIKTNLKKPYESLVHEIDERKQAEEKILKLNRVYAVISQINQTIVRVREKDKILSEACRISVEHGKFRMAWIGMIDEETHLVKPVAYSGVEEGYFSKIKVVFIDDAPEGRGPTGAAIRENRHYVCDDMEKDPRMEPWREEALKRGYRSSIALPIRQFGKVIGAFSLYASVPDFFDQEEIHLLDEVTNDISFALDTIEIAKKEMEAEETLRESEVRLRSVIEQSPVGIAFSRDGITLDANKVYLNMFGYAGIEELRGTSLINQIAPQCRQEIIDKVTRRAQGQEVDITYETIGLRKDDSQFPFQVSVSRIVLPDGPLTISYFNDITERECAEEALREKEHLLSESQRIAHIGSWGWDLTGPIKWTDETYRIYGVSPETFTPTTESLVNLLHPEDRPAMQRWIEACGAGQSPADLEFRVILPDGSVRLLSGRGELIYDTENRPVNMAGTVQDITERKKAEVEIKTINEELIAINRIITAITGLSNIKEILEIVLDEALGITGLEGGTICMVTPANTLELATHRATSEATILDLTTNEIKIGDCLCGECARDHTALILRDRKAVLEFATREATRGEDIRFHAAFPLITGGRCLGVLCVFTRTDRKPEERRLKLLETVTAQIALAVQNAGLFEETLRNAAVFEERVKERTLELEEAQGALVSMVEDLNEKSVQLAQAMEQAQSADRLKSAFLATMSHELRTPLNSIIGFTGIVLQGMSGPLNEEQAKQLAMVKGSANHLLDLINDVLDISKIEAGQVQITRKPFDMRSVIEAALRTVMPLAAKKGLSLDSVIASDVVAMTSDRRRVEQILINLVNNAVKFTEQGEVRISVRRVNSEQYLVNSKKLFTDDYSLTTEADFVEISVTDTGIGIKAEDVGKLFVPFSQIDTGLARSHEGTGLGLSICGKLVELLGGTIRVESEWGKGSKFTFTLPLSS